MSSKVPAGTSSPRPHVQVNNYGRINSPSDDIRVAMVKNTRKAGRSTAASHASCDGDDGDEGHGSKDGDEEHGDDSDEDWPENGHDNSASGDEVAPADIGEDEWWNRPVGSDDEVEEWRAGDLDNDEGADADGEHAEAAAHAMGATGDDGAEADDERLRLPPHPVMLQWIAEAWDQVPRQVIVDAFRHYGISSKLDGTENHRVMSHLHARSILNVSEVMSLGGTTGDNTCLLGQAPEEEEEM
ncbi:unnamed protein product [Closterium sp. NIES-65]|nr:unnamed protein product [Closterium sp. NIES-65]